MQQNINKRKTIRGLGLQVIIMSLILSSLALCGLVVCIYIWSLDTNIQGKIIYFVFGLIEFSVCFYFLCSFGFSSKIAFKGNQMIVKSRNILLCNIDIDCSEFVKCEVIKAKYPVSIKLITSNNVEFQLYGIVFTKYQIKKILKEIQYRGGLQEIDLSNIL